MLTLSCVLQIVVMVRDRDRERKRQRQRDRDCANLVLPAADRGDGQLVSY